MEQTGTIDLFLQDIIYLLEEILMLRQIVILNLATPLVLGGNLLVKLTTIIQIQLVALNYVIDNTGSNLTFNCYFTSNNLQIMVLWKCRC